MSLVKCILLYIENFRKIDSDGVHSLISFTSILDKRVHYDPQRWQKLRWVEGVSLWHLFSITIFPKRSLMEAPFIQRIVARLFFYSCTLKISALSFQLLEAKWEPSCEIYVFVFLSTWGGERPSAIESIFWRTDLCTYVYKGLSSGVEAPCHHIKVGWCSSFWLVVSTSKDGLKCEKFCVHFKVYTCVYGTYITK